MKSVRNISIIAAIIILLAVGFYFISTIEPSEKNPTQTPKPTVSLYSVDKEKITSFSIQNAEENYSFMQENGQWKLKDSRDYRIDPMRVESLLYEFSYVTANEKLTESQEGLSAYGLDSPNRIIKLGLSDGTQAEILIGNTTVDGSLCYVMVKGERAVYSKTVSGCDRLTPLLGELLDLDLYSISEDLVGGFSLRKPGTEEIVLIHNKITAPGQASVYDWKMTAPLVKMVSGYTMKNDLLPNVLSMTAAKATTDSAALGTVIAEYTIWNQDKSESYNVAVGKTEDTYTYLKLQGDPAVYLVDSEKMKFVTLGYMDIVDKTIFVANLTELRSLEIDALEKQFSLTVSGSNYSVNGQQVNGTAFKNAYKSIIGLLIEGYTQKGFSGKPLVTITYSLIDGSQTKVECFAYDERSYGVRVNGQGNLLLRKNQIHTMITELEKLV